MARAEANLSRPIDFVTAQPALPWANGGRPFPYGELPLLAVTRWPLGVRNSDSQFPQPEHSRCLPSPALHRSLDQAPNYETVFLQRNH
jgi:hypothetical protein